MEETLEKLWNEYLSEKCAAIETEEERVLVRNAAEMHKRVNELITGEQKVAMEAFVEASYRNQFFYAKKAFMIGCKFAASFFLEAWDHGKTK